MEIKGLGTTISNKMYLWEDAGINNVLLSDRSHWEIFTQICSIEVERAKIQFVWKLNKYIGWKNAQMNGSLERSWLPYTERERVTNQIESSLWWNVALECRLFSHTYIVANQIESHHHDYYMTGFFVPIDNTVTVVIPWQASHICHERCGSTNYTVAITCAAL